MKVFLLNCFLMLAFLSLIGCSQNQKSVNLQVSASFTVGAAGFTGGLIAYGEGPNGAKFAVSSGTGQSINTTISDGTWKIYVMGWEDPNNLKFRGTKYCGMSEVNLASNDTNVNITLSTTCTGTNFASDTVPKSVLISSCGGFYTYNPTYDTYADPATDAFCSTLPTALQGTFEYYRLTLPTIQGPTVSAGIQSECIVAKGASGPRLEIPTKKFPFRVMMFRSKQDCMNPTSPRMSAFGFLNGLQAGNQPSFDHHYSPDAVNNNARLFLPTSTTRRGYSPFMGMIPRILCGSGDCFTKPVLTFNMLDASGTNVSYNGKFNVPWYSDMSMDNNKDKTIIKGFRPTNVSSNTCDSPTLSLLNQSPYFSVAKCSIQNGDLRGNFVRNELICRNTTDFATVADLYERNGRIYQYDSSNHKIHVYSEKGIHLNTVSLALVASQTYKSMATDSDNNLYVVIWDTGVLGSNPRKLLKYSFSYGNYNNTPYDWNSSTYSHLQNIEKIEVTDNGKIVVATQDTIKAFEVTSVNTLATPPNSVSLAPVAGGVSSSIKKILFRNSKLYILTFESSYPKLYAATLSGVTGLSLSSLGSSYFTGATHLEYESFHYTDIAGSKYFVFNPKDFTSDLQIYPITGLTPSVTIAYAAGDIPYGGPIIMVKNMIYKKSYTGFTARDFIPGTSANVVGSTLGTCKAQLTQAVTTNSPAYALNLRSESVPKIDILFDEAFRYLGIRDVDTEDTFYYFQSLAEGDKNEGQNAGGILGHAEQMLGPDGVGGILNGLYPEKTCTQIVALLPSTGFIIKTLNLFDIIDGTTQALSMILSKNGMDEMGDFVGYPSDSSTKYDLAVTASWVGKPDKMKIQLKCGQKRGSMEHMEYEVSERESRNRLLWNIGTNSYYEQYGLEDYKDNNLDWKTKASVTRLVKTPALSGSNVRIDIRHLEIDRNNTSASPSIEGSVVEVFRAHSSGEKLMTTKVSTGNIPQTLWNTPGSASIGPDPLSSIISYNSLKTILNINSGGTATHSAPGLCMSTSNGDPAGSSAASCTNPDWIPSTSLLPSTLLSPSLNSDPSMASVSNLDDLNDETAVGSTSTSSMNSAFSNVFELEY